VAADADADDDNPGETFRLFPVTTVEDGKVLLIGLVLLIE
jgi:hypothetical protein